MANKSNGMVVLEIDYSNVQLPVFPRPLLAMEQHADDIVRVRKNLYNLGLIDDIELASTRREQDYTWEFLKVCFLGVLPLTTYDNG